MVDNCGLEELVIENCPNLELLSFRHNKVKKIDLTKLTKLQGLYCSNNQLEELDLSNNLSLKHLVCDNNPIGKLEVAHLAELESLYCFKCNLEELDCSGLKKLEGIYCANNFFVYELDGEEEVSHTLVKIKVQGCKSLEILDCAENSIEELDTSNLENLKSLSLKENPYLFVLKIVNCTKLEHLDYSRVSDVSMDCDVTIENCPEISRIFCDEDLSVDLERFPNLKLVEIGKYEEIVDDDGDSYTLYKIIKRIDFKAIRNIERVEKILTNPDDYSHEDLMKLDREELYGVPSELREKLVKLGTEKFNKIIREQFTPYELPKEEEDFSPEEVLKANQLFIKGVKRELTLAEFKQEYEQLNLSLISD